MPASRVRPAKRGGVIPGLILLAFTIDLVIGVLYLVNLVLGNPVEILARFIDLDRERSLPTWFSSVQWFGAAICVGLFAAAITRAPGSGLRAWVVYLLPAGFLAFSLDEIAQVHEAFGVILDGLLLGGAREGTSLAMTGIWIVVIGIPSIIATVVVSIVLLPYLRRSPGAARKLAAGMAIFLTAAVGVEALSNLVTANSFIGGLQILVEEVLELIAATIVLWGSYELAREAQNGASVGRNAEPSRGLSDR